MGIFVLMLVLLGIMLAVALLVLLILAIVLSVALVGAGTVAIGVAGSVGSGFIKNPTTKTVLFNVWLGILSFGLGCIALVCWWVFDPQLIGLPFLLIITVVLFVALFVSGCLGLTYVQRIQKKSVRYLLNALFIIFVVVGLLAVISAVLMGLFLPTRPEILQPNMTWLDIFDFFLGGQHVT